MANILNTAREIDKVMNRVEKINNVYQITEDWLKQAKRSISKINSLYEKVVMGLLNNEEDLTEEERAEIFDILMRCNFSTLMAGSYSNTDNKVGSAIKTYKVNKALTVKDFDTGDRLYFKDLWGNLVEEQPQTEEEIARNNVPLNQDINILLDVISYSVYEILFSFEVMKSNFKIIKNWDMKKHFVISDLLLCYLGLSAKAIDTILDKDTLNNLRINNFVTPIQLYNIGAFNFDLPIAEACANLTTIIYSYVMTTKNYNVLNKLIETSIYNQDIFVDNGYLVAGGVFSYIKAVGSWWLNFAAKNKIITENFLKLDTPFIVSTLADDTVSINNAIFAHKIIDSQDAFDNVVVQMRENCWMALDTIDMPFLEYLTSQKSLKYDRSFIFLTYFNMYKGNAKYLSLESVLAETISWEYIKQINDIRAVLNGIREATASNKDIYEKIKTRYKGILVDLSNNTDRYELAVECLYMLANGTKWDDNRGYIRKHLVNISKLLSLMKSLRIKLEKDIDNIKKLADSTVEDFYLVDYLVFEACIQYIAFYRLMKKDIELFGLKKQAVRQEIREIEKFIPELENIVGKIDKINAPSVYYLLGFNVVNKYNNLPIHNKVIKFQNDNSTMFNIDTYTMNAQYGFMGTLRGLKLYMEQLKTQVTAQREIAASKETAAEGRKKLEQARNMERELQKTLQDNNIKINSLENQNTALQEKLQSKSISEEEKKELLQLRKEKEQFESLTEKQERLLEQMQSKLNKLRTQLSTYIEEDVTEDIEVESIVTFAEKAERLREKRIVCYSGLSSLPGLVDKLGFELIHCPKDGNLKSITANLGAFDCIVIETGHIGHSICERIESVNKARKVPICLIDSTNAKLVCDGVYDFCIRKGIITV